MYVGMYVCSGVVVCMCVCMHELCGMCGPIDNRPRHEHMHKFKIMQAHDKASWQTGQCDVLRLGRGPIQVGAEIAFSVLLVPC